MRSWSGPALVKRKSLRLKSDAGQVWQERLRRHMSKGDFGLICTWRFQRDWNARYRRTKLARQNVHLSFRKKGSRQDKSSREGSSRLLLFI